MDPTKSFDHLDPKLKETYARVMGTPTGGTTGPAQSPAVQSTPADPTLSASPSIFNPPAAADANQSTSSLDPALSPSPNSGPNPGTGPTVSNMPVDATSAFTPPPATLSPAADANTPNASPFFSNPSPTTTDPTQQTGGAPIATPTTEPPAAPVTPYSPDNSTGGAPVSAPVEQYTQPLPSPSAVAQAGPHQASALLRVLYIIGAVIFFSIYTVFWIKVFNLPFLF